MITPLIFWALVAIAFVMAIYVFIDNHNRIFGHIFLAVMSMILFFILGITLMTGNVGDVVPVSVNETVNNTTTLYTYSTLTMPMQDSGISYFFILMGVVMLIMTILSVIEILRESVSGLDIGGDEYD